MGADQIRRVDYRVDARYQSRHVRRIRQVAEDQLEIQSRHPVAQRIVRQHGSAHLVVVSQQLARQPACHLPGNSSDEYFHRASSVAAPRRALTRSLVGSMGGRRHGDKLARRTGQEPGERSTAAEIMPIIRLMTLEVSRQTREQMIRDGFCVVPDVLTDAFVAELREETVRLNATEQHHPDTKYQGTHLGIKYADNPIMRRLAEWQPTRQALDELGFGDFVPLAGLIVLTKPARGPALYWHQDWMQWNDPLSCTPWPQKIFVSFYLEGTSVENGCLKIIPGTHLKRIPLHDQLVTAHEQGARFIEEDHPIMFGDHPDQVNVEVGPRDLVIADARILHSAYKNHTDEPRDLLLLWHSRPDTVPANWEGEVPRAIAERDPEAEYEGTRIPGKYLTALS